MKMLKILVPTMAVSMLVACQQQEVVGEGYDNVYPITYANIKDNDDISYIDSEDSWDSEAAPAEEVIEQPRATGLSKIFSFDFNSYVVSNSSRSLLNKHIEVLNNNPTLTVKVEGHGDERGSREYNLSLGERRAHSIAVLLRAGGIDPSRIVSYGEERPIDSASNESAWRKNRRVEIIY